MKKNLIIALVLSIKVLQSQDNHLSQYFISSQLINPASFGVLNSFEAGVQYKSQWNTFTKGYTTYSGFINARIKPKNKKKGFFSLGFSLVSDKTGDGNLSSMQTTIPVNYTIKMNDDNYLTTGVSLGFNQKTIVGSNLTWGTQYDGFSYNASLPGENQIQQIKSVFDVGGGVAWVYKKNQKGFADSRESKNVLGLSVAHINQPSFSFYNNGSEKILMRYNFYEYFHIHFGETRLSMTPSLMWQYQGAANEIILGAMLNYKTNSDSRITGVHQSGSISGGLFYRIKDAVTANLIIEHKNISFGTAYDINLSQLKNSTKSRGGFEVFIKIKNPFNYLYRGHAGRSII